MSEVCRSEALALTFWVRIRFVNEGTATVSSSAAIDIVISSSVRVKPEILLGRREIIVSICISPWSFLPLVSRRLVVDAVEAQVAVTCLATDRGGSDRVSRHGEPGAQTILANAGVRIRAERVEARCLGRRSHLETTRSDRCRVA